MSAKSISLSLSYIDIPLVLANFELSTDNPMSILRPQEALWSAGGVQKEKGK